MSSTLPPDSPTTYDETPYPSASFPQTHPLRLAAMGRLFGLTIASPGKARVLELGCANGANLLPMAAMLPAARFLGIDASKIQIEAAHKAASAAGLKNVELRQQNILEFPASEGQFDYIICHGIFSWVAEPVREKIFEICRRHLAPHGVAYVSYNALPGWNLRRSLRDMMLYHAANFADPKAKVGQARALLAFLTESVPTENSAYGMLLRDESKLMSRQLDSYLRHDILEEENTPFYFHDFIQRAGKHELQYLSEPNIAQMLATNFPDKVRETLGRLSGKIVAQEQYMDFLRNRSFRQTLLCRSNVPLQRKIPTAVMRHLAFQSLLKQPDAPADLNPGVSATFASRSGLQITASDSFLKAILQALAEAASTNILSFQELLDEARARSRKAMGSVPANRDAVDEATLERNMLNLFAKGFVEIFSDPVRSRGIIPERPDVGPLVRYQALNAQFVTNRVHQALPADGAARNIMDLCDGSRNHDELLAALVQRAKEGELQVKEGTTLIRDESRLRELLRPRLEAGLRNIAASGFFAP